MEFFKKTIKRILYTIVILTVITMSFQIWRIPDYKGGDASVVYSEDGKYKGMIVYPSNKGITISLLVRVKDNELLAIEPLTRDSEVIRAHSWFTCRYTKYNDKCFHPADPMGIVELPPSLWHRVHAWLTVKIKGLEDPNLNENNKTPKY